MSTPGTNSNYGSADGSSWPGLPKFVQNFPKQAESVLAFFQNPETKEIINTFSSQILCGLGTAYFALFNGRASTYAVIGGMVVFGAPKLISHLPSIAKGVADFLLIEKRIAQVQFKIELLAKEYGFSTFFEKNETKRLGMFIAAYAFPAIIPTIFGYEFAQILYSIGDAPVNAGS